MINLERSVLVVIFYFLYLNVFLLFVQNKYNFKDFKGYLYINIFEG